MEYIVNYVWCKSLAFTTTEAFFKMAFMHSYYKKNDAENDSFLSPAT